MEASSPFSGTNTSDEEDASERRRRMVAIFTVLFVMVSIGLFTALSPSTGLFGFLLDGSGDLTVAVEDQYGASVSGEEVEILDTTTGEVVAAGTTDSTGEVTFQNLDHDEYDVLVSKKTTQVVLDSDSERTTVEVAVAPPKSSRFPVFRL